MRESPPRPGDEGGMDGSLGGRQGGYEPLVDPTYRRLERPDPASLFVVAGRGKTWRDDKRAQPKVVGGKTPYGTELAAMLPWSISSPCSAKTCSVRSRSKTR